MVQFFKFYDKQTHLKIAEIGVGQATIAPYRYAKVDYLPWIYNYEFEVQSARPTPVVSFDTLIFPFDKYTWYFTISSSIGVFTLLVCIQKAWTYASGTKPIDGWMFQGNLSFNLLWTDIDTLIYFSDLVLALTPSVDETVRWELYVRPSFIKSRLVLLLTWLLLANILSHAYKGALLSSLINIRYTEPLETMDQLVESGLPFYVLGGSVMVWLAKSDPRTNGKLLNDRRFDMPFPGKVDDKYLKE